MRTREIIKVLRQLELLFGADSSFIPRPQRKRRKKVSLQQETAHSGASRSKSTPLNNSLFSGDMQGVTAIASLKANSETCRDDFLYTVWQNLRQEFFPEHAHIDDYFVSWSSRPQKRVLASCNIRRRRVVVARELFEPSASRWIPAVLYHEMCHAVIGEAVHTSTSGKRLWHGREFRNLEARHPDIVAMNSWISTGGWAMAVRSNRTRLAWRARNNMS